MAFTHYGMPISPTFLLEPDASQYLCVGDSVTIILLLVGKEHTKCRRLDCFWDCCVSVRFAAALGIHWAVLDSSKRIIDTDSIEDWDSNRDNSIGHYNSIG